jgi:hypothetical protein
MCSTHSLFAILREPPLFHVSVSVCGNSTELFANQNYAPIRWIIRRKSDVPLERADVQIPSYTFLSEQGLAMGYKLGRDWRVVTGYSCSFSSWGCMYQRLRKGMISPKTGRAATSRR